MRICYISSLYFFLALFTFLLFANWLISGSKGQNWNTVGYIKFKSFLAFYNINPNRWELLDDYVRFLNNPRKFGDTYCFRFIDYYRYLIWRHKENNRIDSISSAQKYQEMIDILKQDIADFEKRNTQETSEKLNEIWRGAIKYALLQRTV